MDGHRFDDLVMSLASAQSRRRVLRGLVGSLVGGAALIAGRHSAAAVTQATCGNVVCADDPGICHDGCVCCAFGNGNSRCMPPNNCGRYGGEVIEPCLPEQMRCDGACTDLGTKQNCTDCGDTCGVDEFCGESGCTPCGSCNLHEVCGDTGCVCPTGFELINGGCFRIATGLSDPICSGCGIAGSVEGSGNYVCFSGLFGSCSTSGDCPSGSACQVGFHGCIGVC